MKQSEVWLAMAEQAHQAAVGLHDPELRRQMLLIARKYETLAEGTKAFAKIADVANSNDPDTDSSA
jgi:hypothetical protein